jgi:hypothetical protein
MSQALEISVKNGPAAIPLTRTFGPKAKAKERVNAFKPDFAAP